MDITKQGLKDLVRRCNSPDRRVWIPARANLKSIYESVCPEDTWSDLETYEGVAKAIWKAVKEKEVEDPTPKLSHFEAIAVVRQAVDYYSGMKQHYLEAMKQVCDALEDALNGVKNDKEDKPTRPELLDYFAFGALNATLRDFPHTAEQTAANIAFNIAEAMIKERTRRLSSPPEE